MFRVRLKGMMGMGIMDAGVLGVEANNDAGGERCDA